MAYKDRMIASRSIAAAVREARIEMKRAADGPAKGTRTKKSPRFATEVRTALDAAIDALKEAGFDDDAKVITDAMWNSDLEEVSNAIDEVLGQEGGEELPQEVSDARYAVDSAMNGPDDEKSSATRGSTLPAPHRRGVPTSTKLREAVRRDLPRSEKQVTRGTRTKGNGSTTVVLEFESPDAAFSAFDAPTDGSDTEAYDTLERLISQYDCASSGRSSGSSELTYDFDTQEDAVGFFREATDIDGLADAWITGPDGDKLDPNALDFDDIKGAPKQSTKAAGASPRSGVRTKKSEFAGVLADLQYDVSQINRAVTSQDDASPEIEEWKSAYNEWVSWAESRSDEDPTAGLPEVLDALMYAAEGLDEYIDADMIESLRNAADDYDTLVTRSAHGVRTKVMGGRVKLELDGVGTDAIEDLVVEYGGEITGVAGGSVGVVSIRFEDAGLMQDFVDAIESDGGNAVTIVDVEEDEKSASRGVRVKGDDQWIDDLAAALEKTTKLIEDFGLDPQSPTAEEILAGLEAGDDITSDVQELVGGLRATADILEDDGEGVQATELRDVSDVLENAMFSNKSAGDPVATKGSANLADVEERLGAAMNAMGKAGGAADSAGAETEDPDEADAASALSELCSDIAGDLQATDADDRDGIQGLMDQIAEIEITIRDEAAAEQVGTFTEKARSALEDALELLSAYEGKSATGSKLNTKGGEDFAVEFVDRLNGARTGLSTLLDGSEDFHETDAITQSLAMVDDAIAEANEENWDGAADLLSDAASYLDGVIGSESTAASLTAFAEEARGVNEYEERSASGTRTKAGDFDFEAEFATALEAAPSGNARTAVEEAGEAYMSGDLQTAYDIMSRMADLEWDGGYDPSALIEALLGNIEPMDKSAKGITTKGIVRDLKQAVDEVIQYEVDNPDGEEEWMDRFDAAVAKVEAACSEGEPYDVLEALGDAQSAAYDNDSALVDVIAQAIENVEEIENDMAESGDKSYSAASRLKRRADLDTKRAGEGEREALIKDYETFAMEYMGAIEAASDAVREASGEAEEAGENDGEEDEYGDLVVDIEDLGIEENFDDTPMGNNNEAYEWRMMAAELKSTMSDPLLNAEAKAALNEAMTALTQFGGDEWWSQYQDEDDVD